MRIRVDSNKLHTPYTTLMPRHHSLINKLRAVYRHTNFKHMHAVICVVIIETHFNFNYSITRPDFHRDAFPDITNPNLYKHTVGGGNMGKLFADKTAWASRHLHRHTNTIGIYSKISYHQKHNHHLHAPTCRRGMKIIEPVSWDQPKIQNTL